MIHFFRRIRRGLLAENKFKKYLLYAIGEIILVVIGILIALQINNANNQRILNKAEVKSYKNIKRQVIDDKNELVKVKAFNKYYNGVYKFAVETINEKNYKKTDSVGYAAMGLSQYSDFHRNSNIYESLVNSGDIKLLKNSEITSRLQKLEMAYVFVNNLEQMHWEMIINNLSPVLRNVMNYSTFKPVKPKELFEVEMQNLFAESLYLTYVKEDYYTEAIIKIDSIISLIDKELKIE